jgi:putative ABC transport system permease protein
VRYEGMPKDDPTRLPIVEMRRVTPAFFDVTAQRLLAGRTLRLADDELAPRAVVVNRALVERDFKGQSAVGRRFHLGDTTFGTIVGVVSDIKNAGPVAPPAPEFYVTYAQGDGTAPAFPLVVRVRGGEPTAVAAQVRAAIRRVDPSAAVADVKPMTEVIATSLGRPRFYFSLLGTFAAVAIVLAVAGLYGVLSYAVAQRTREFGIQLALGSPPRLLLRRVTTQGLRLVVVGLVVGLAGAVSVTRLMEFMLYGVSPLDARTWVLATGALLGAGLLAALVPARRATRVDPVRALQAE